MPKHGKSRKFKRYLRGQINEQSALGTLGGNTLLKTNVTDIVIDTTWISSIKAAWALKNFTEGADIGPILVGIAHSDYTAAEIEEWIEQSESWSANDLKGMEVARRKIRRVGLLQSLAGANAARLNDGKQIHTKCGWVLYPGQTIALWFYNVGTAAIATTDPDVTTQGHANLWPM